MSNRFISIWRRFTWYPHFDSWSFDYNTLNMCMSPFLFLIYSFFIYDYLPLYICTYTWDDYMHILITALDDGIKHSYLAWQGDIGYTVYRLHFLDTSNVSMLQKWKIDLDFLLLLGLSACQPGGRLCFSRLFGAVRETPKQSASLWWACHRLVGMTIVRQPKGRVFPRRFRSCHRSIPKVFLLVDHAYA